MRGYNRQYTDGEAERLIGRRGVLVHDFGDLKAGTPWEVVGRERIGLRQRALLIRWEGETFRVANCLNRRRDRIDPLVDLMLRCDFEAIVAGRPHKGGPRGRGARI